MTDKHLVMPSDHQRQTPDREPHDAPTGRDRLRVLGTARVDDSVVEPPGYASRLHRRFRFLNGEVDNHNGVDRTVEGAQMN